MSEVESAPAQPEIESSAPDTDEIASEDLAQEDSSTSQEPQPEPPKGVAKRIKELTTLRYEAEERARRAEENTRRLQEALLARQEPQQEQKTEQPPKLEEYQDYAQFSRDLARYEARQIIREEREAAQKQAEIDRQQQVANQRQTTFREREIGFQAEMPDYRAVITDPSAAISQNMVDLAMVSEKGPALLYHLAKNRDEAVAIYHLSREETALALGRLEAKISQAQPRRNSNAPAPVNPLSGGPGPAIVDDSRLSGDEWAKRERQRMAQLRK